MLQLSQHAASFYNSKDNFQPLSSSLQPTQSKESVICNCFNQYDHHEENRRYVRYLYSEVLHTQSWSTNCCTTLAFRLLGVDLFYTTTQPCFLSPFWRSKAQSALCIGSSLLTLVLKPSLSDHPHMSRRWSSIPRGPEYRSSTSCKPLSFSPHQERTTHRCMSWGCWSESLHGWCNRKYWAGTCVLGWQGVDCKKRQGKSKYPSATLTFLSRTEWLE